MHNSVPGEADGLSRRAFLTTTAWALAGMAASRPVRETQAEPRQPKRGGTLRLATRSDVSGLDIHRNIVYLVSMPLAAITQGLMDLDMNCEPVPGVAASWEASKDLQTYTFILRKGVLFHNGREVDAEAVKWNFARLQNPKIAHPLSRSALENLKELETVDKYTVRCHLHEPSAAFPADVVYYPCALMAPDSVEKADLHPISCGPFKFVSWDRYNITEMARFEHYFETDSAGNALPYLDSLIGRPKREDRVRLTSLRAGEVDLIDSMAYDDATGFTSKYAGMFQTWPVPTLGTSFLLFNLETGPFADRNIRLAAAHAVDHEAIKQAVFQGLGDTAKGFYAPASPWYVENIAPWPSYDPDKAKFLLKQAKAVGTEILLQASNVYPYMQQTAELVQAMWTDVGLKVRYNLYDEVALNQKRRERDFHADSTAASYRWDPDGWYGRQILSTAPATKANSGFHNAQADKLIGEARRTADRKKRLELYGALEGIINEELPLLYLHHLTLLQAGSLRVQGYRPAVSGAFSIRGSGLRTAWME
ncbi:MAG: ABC transporter substrate-binding protein [Candidatus Tectimicrobiota bacterium]